MKLRELVANSLPRVRRRKKKTGVGVSVAATDGGAVAVQDEATVGSPGMDSSSKMFQSARSRFEPQDKYSHGIEESNWKGNALYRGLVAARAVEFNSRFMATSYSSPRGLVTSHSADEFTSHMLMSRSFDSRMATAESTDSPHVWSLSERYADPLPSPQQYYHCHYHRHNHHHYHLHHQHPMPMAPLAQNHQKIQPELRSGKNFDPLKTEDAKSEPGFFRKSFASFRSIRKHAKTNKDSKQTALDQHACQLSACSDFTQHSAERKSNEKRPVKPKRKSIKGFSKSKENTDSCSRKHDNCWTSDTDPQIMTSPIGTRAEANLTLMPAYERSRIRECSVESCKSRLFGSREGSAARDVDLTGFDSASLSGYESDFPLSKVHRSRSRIKTNPWLPSPQPSMSGISRGEFHESKADQCTVGKSGLRVPRSASFEHQRSGAMALSTPAIKDPMQAVSMNQRHRSLTPSDIRLTLNLNVFPKPSSDITKSITGTDEHKSGESQACKKPVGILPQAFNNLNTEAPKSRPSSMVSPNSEFVMLADNLEQLANNISFDYEDMLDTTLESVSVSQEDGRASLQELLTDEENGSVTLNSSKSDDAHSAPSPDSGIGGLGSTDGDEAGTPNAQKEQAVPSMECFPQSTACFGNAYATDRNLGFSMSNKLHDMNKDKLCRSAKCENFTSFNNIYPTISSNDAIQTADSRNKIGCSTAATPFCDISATISQSNPSNASSRERVIRDAKLEENTIQFPKQGSLGKLEAGGDPNTSVLMVDERLDIRFRPPYRHIVMGTAGVTHDNLIQLAPSGRIPLGILFDSSGCKPRIVQRPCVLNASSSIGEMPRRMNDIEKTTKLEEGRKTWSGEFDIPRNITAFESVESPTDNWQIDGQFSVYAIQETKNYVQEPEISQNELSPKDNCGNGNKLIENEKLVVKLDDICMARNTNDKCAEVSFENSSSLDSSVNIREGESASCEMSDACVQTDLDEDLCQWEDTETLESLEQTGYDPLESTRIWLLTGNMQGSTDTGYSSLARDSQILMDEDSLILAGELEENAAAVWLSYGESFNTNSSRDNTPRNSACLDSECTPLLKPRRPQSADIRNTQPITDGESFNEAAKMALLNKGSLLSRPKSTRESNLPKSTKTIPQSTVNQMFSNIESQFHEIFQQIYKDKRLSSDSSDSTLKSSGSDDVISGELNKNFAQYSKAQDSDIGDTKNNLKSRSGISMTQASKRGDMLRPQAESEISPRLKVSNAGNTSKENANIRSAALGAISSAATRGNAAPVETPPGTERADYLEFLKDAPLDRSHLKRPLFLVPGLGPVDMSSSEQVNLFSTNRSLSPFGPLLRSATPPDLSPSSAHSGRKLKCKKGEHRLSAQTTHLCDCGFLSCGHCFYHNNPAETTRPKSEPNKATGSKLAVDGYHSKKRVPLPRSEDGAKLTSSFQCSSLSSEIIQNPLSEAQPITTAGGYLPTSFTYKQNNNATDKSVSERRDTTGNPSDRREVIVSSTEKKEATRSQATGSLTEKVISLRREKDVVLQKILDAQKEEMFRHEQRQQLQKVMVAQRKDALLGTLHEFRNRLEEQSCRLAQRENSAEHV